MKRAANRDISPKDGREKRIAIVQALDPGEEIEVDVLRLPATLYFYAFIEKFEIERTRGRGYLCHVNFYCISATWFNLLAKNLSNIPPANTIAQVGQSRLVEVTTTVETIDAVRHAINDPHFHEGWWVMLEVSDQRVDPLDVPCVVYLPAAGSIDPATIGTTPNSELGFIRSIARVRPPSMLIKLLKFSHGWRI